MRCTDRFQTWNYIDIDSGLRGILPTTKSRRMASATGLNVRWRWGGPFPLETRVESAESEVGLLAGAQSDTLLILNWFVHVACLKLPLFIVLFSPPPSQQVSW